MGFMEDAKKTAEAVGEHLKDAWDDTADRIGDKVDEVKADAKAAKADAEADLVHERNEAKERMRDE